MADTPHASEARHLDPQGLLVPAPHNGSVVGKRVRFTDVNKFLEVAPAEQEVYGDPLAEFLTMTGGSFDERLQPADVFPPETLVLITVTFTGYLPNGWSIEVGQNAPAYGCNGGAYYSVVLDRQGAKKNLLELKDVGVVNVHVHP